ncbi:hypothetical protein FISHEDRAFT_56901 [Fistulina hepatica ATCC 64428]|nr:hypothetical protein FISHEDRAFT_56901 [Fistulina hepatica ATCC 64428]
MSDVFIPPPPSSFWNVPQVDILKRDGRAFQRDLTAALNFASHHSYYEAPLYALYKTILQEFDIRIGISSNFAVISSPQYQLLFKGEDDEDSGKGSRRHPDFGTVIFDDTPNPQLLFLSEIKRLAYPHEQWFDSDSAAFIEAATTTVKRADVQTQLRGQAKYAFQQFPNQNRVSIFLFIGPYYYLYTYVRSRTSPIAPKAPRRSRASRKRARRDWRSDDSDDDDDEKDPDYEDSDEAEQDITPIYPVRMNVALDFNNGIATLSADFLYAVSMVLKQQKIEKEVTSFPFDSLQNVEWFPLV